MLKNHLQEVRNCSISQKDNLTEFASLLYTSEIKEGINFCDTVFFREARAPHLIHSVLMLPIPESSQEFHRH